MGKGSAGEIKPLETYGKYLGMMLELLKDTKVSLNLTLELEKKIQQNQLPMLLLMATEKSEQIKEEIENLNKKAKISPKNMGHLVDNLLGSTAWKEITNHFKEVTEKCQTALPIKNEAAKMLLTIAKCQSEIFCEIAKVKK